MKRILYVVVAAICLLTGCAPDDESWVQAGFTTDYSYEYLDSRKRTDCSLQMGVYG